MGNGALMGDVLSTARDVCLTYETGLSTATSAKEFEGAWSRKGDLIVCRVD